MKTKVKEVIVEVKVKGRPSNPESARQKKIAERNVKRASGELKKGRPSVSGSKRQAVLAAREAKKAAGIEIKRGRPKTKIEETKIAKTKIAKTKVVEVSE
jgi:hypothetical protein